MAAHDLFLAQHARAHAIDLGPADFSNQDLVLRHITDELMRRRPIPGLNSLAWLFWHISRVEDIAANLIIAERPQVFDEGDWAARLHVPRRDLGAGMTDPEVDDLSATIDLAALPPYRAAVGRRTQDVVRALPPEVLAIVIDAPLLQRARDAGAFGPNADWVPRRWEGKPKSFALMHTVLAHSYLHLGEAQVIRGLLGLPNP